MSSEDLGLAFFALSSGMLEAWFRNEPGYQANLAEWESRIKAAAENHSEWQPEYGLSEGRFNKFLLDHHGEMIREFTDEEQQILHRERESRSRFVGQIGPHLRTVLVFADRQQFGVEPLLYLFRCLDSCDSKVWDPSKKDETVDVLLQLRLRLDSESTEASEWSLPFTPAELRKMYRISRDTLSHRLKNQTIRNKKLNTKSYQIHKDHLPAQ